MRLATVSGSAPCAGCGGGICASKSTDESAPAPDDAVRVLSTLHEDGSRKWIHPRIEKGRFYRRRLVVAWALLLIFNGLPWIWIAGKPSILLDLPRREFTFFGRTFLATDTVIFMLAMVAIIVAVFLVTALFGRLWCGWACPQTVYMEFVYRPLERWLEKRDRNGVPKRTGVWTALKYVLFFIISFHLAHTFLAYFVGVDQVLDWSRGSPFAHPTSFITVLAVTGLMLFDFGFFREQVCIVACPYGRLQSVLLDRQSLIIGYDEKRGEPRGKIRRGDQARPTGDCVDCHRCVTCCPTGIDIRNGLQLECIGCAQCIDACDDVMAKLGRPLGLIRYSSQDAMDSGRKRLIRPRVIIYPVVLAIVLAAMVTLIVRQAPANVTVLRGGGAPYAKLASGAIANRVSIKIVNRTDEPRTFTARVEDVPEARFEGEGMPWTVGGRETVTVEAVIVTPPDVFDLGRARAHVVVESDDGFVERRAYRLLGPWGAAGAPAVSEDSP